MERELTPWEEVKKLYGDKFNADEHLVDYIAVSDILKLCVSGLSNTTISRIMDLDCIYIERVNFSFLGFLGWQLDLDLSPWKIFKSVNGDRLVFEKQIWDLTELLNDDIIDLAYRVCSIYSSIRKEIDEFYECN
jgi:hypothetical protein